MNMYVEDFIIQQLISCYCILRLIIVTTKQESKLYKSLLGCLIYTVGYLVLALSSINYIIYNLIYFIIPYLVVLVVFKPHIKQSIINYLIFNIFYLCTNGLILSLASTTFYSSAGIITYTKYNPIIVLSCIVIFTYIYEGLLSTAKIKIKSNSLIHRIDLYLNNQKLSINAFVDTGNLLNIQGRGVIVLDYITFLRLISLTNTTILPHHSLNVGTINETKSLSIYNLDKVEINLGKERKIINNCPIGVTMSNAFIDKNYKALISPDMI